MENLQNWEQKMLYGYGTVKIGFLVVDNMDRLNAEVNMAILNL